MPSATCYALVRKSERLRLQSFRDRGILSIGWRHSGPDVCLNKKITYDEAETLLHNDLTRASDCVLELTGGNVSQGQLDALSDFVFDLGSDKLKHSTLLRKHRAGNYIAAAHEFGRHVYDLDGRFDTTGDIIKRRACEAVLYLSDKLP